MASITCTITLEFVLKKLLQNFKKNDYSFVSNIKRHSFFLVNDLLFCTYGMSKYIKGIFFKRNPTIPYIPNSYTLVYTNKNRRGGTPRQVDKVINLHEQLENHIELCLDNGLVFATQKNNYSRPITTHYIANLTYV